MAARVVGMLGKFARSYQKSTTSPTRLQVDMVLQTDFALHATTEIEFVHVGTHAVVDCDCMPVQSASESQIVTRVA